MKTKLLRILGSMGVVATPIVTIVSCGAEEVASSPAYEKISTNLIEQLEDSLKSVKDAETLSEYTTFVKGLFVEEQTESGSSLDLTSITGVTEEKVVENAKKIKPWTRPLKIGKAIVYVGHDKKRLIIEKALAHGIQFVADNKTPGSPAMAEKLATSVTQQSIKDAIDQATTKAAMITVLNNHTIDAKNETAFITTTVTKAADVDGAKTAAKALITADVYSKTYQSAAAEVFTVVTINKKDYTLGSYQTNMKVRIMHFGKKDMKSKKRIIHFRMRIKDDNTYKGALIDLMTFAHKYSLYLDKDGTPMNFITIKNAANKAEALKAAIALLRSVWMDFNQIG